MSEPIFDPERLPLSPLVPQHAWLYRNRRLSGWRHRLALFLERHFDRPYPIETIYSGPAEAAPPAANGVTIEWTGQGTIHVY